MQIEWFSYFNELKKKFKFAKLVLLKIIYNFFVTKWTIYIINKFQILF